MDMVSFKFVIHVHRGGEGLLPLKFLFGVEKMVCLWTVGEYSKISIKQYHCYNKNGRAILLSNCLIDMYGLQVWQFSDGV